MLVPDKCSIAIVRHKRESNKLRVIKGIDNTISIKIIDDSGDQKEIKKKHNGTGEMAMGIMFNPTNNMDDEIAYLRGKRGSGRSGANWVSKESRCVTVITDNYSAYKEYALPATNLSHKQLHLTNFLAWV
jgi:hypothetical protein